MITSNIFRTVIGINIIVIRFFFYYYYYYTQYVITIFLGTISVSGEGNMAWKTGDKKPPNGGN